MTSSNRRISVSSVGRLTHVQQHARIANLPESTDLLGFRGHR
jgi:hypothetical protein